MSDFREHAKNHLRTAAGTYIWADFIEKLRCEDLESDLAQQ